jgi:protein-L-isoaspartate(D-aspartate) O-methyltransferase
MVDGQIRPADITDVRVISAMLEVPRERFVPAAAAALAYLDQDLPVGANRCLLKPMVLAKLVHVADIHGSDKVLDVGCTTGYAAAVVATMAGQVVALEEDAGLAKTAETGLAGTANVSVVTGPLTAGWAQGGPYDVILLEGAIEIEPNAFCAQLKEGGRLVCVLGKPPSSKAMLYIRSGNELGGRPIFDTAAPPLPGFGKKPEFAF